MKNPLRGKKKVKNPSGEQQRRIRRIDVM